MYSVVAIMKDEAPYLAEWIEFHKIQGFDNFHLYDNGSTDASVEIAEKHGADVIDFPGNVKQLDAYQHALVELPRGSWAAFIDIDEYLYCPSGKQVVEQVEIFGARWSTVAVPWLIFGDSEWVSKPPEATFITIDAYTHREEGPNDHVKPIMRVDPKLRFLDPHHTNAPFASKVHADGQIICNHYWSRSTEECMLKFARGRADVRAGRKEAEYFDTRDAYNAVEDTRLRDQCAPQLRAILGM